MFSIFHDLLSGIFNFAILVKNDFLTSYVYGFSMIKALEIISLICAIIFIHIMVKENRYAWLLGAFNCCLLIFILGSQGFLGQILLYMVFLFNSLYAFFRWNKRDKNNNLIVKIKWLKPKTSLLILVGLLCLVYGIVTFIQFLKTILPITSNKTFLDIFILVFSLYAIILQANKNIEGWFFFTIVDACSFMLYINSGLYVLSIGSAYITVLTAYGFVRWVIKYRQEKRIKNLVY